MTVATTASLEPAAATSTFGSRAFEFYTSLIPPAVPRGIRVMNPYAERVARGYVRSFLSMYFSDNRPRVLVFGINPGRFGAGITGVTFTDPIALADMCHIENDLRRRRELSSIFIYDFVERHGGVRRFYQRFFLTAVSPLGFTRREVNLNYYDVPELMRRVTPFISSAMEKQIGLGGRRDHAIVLGRGENLRYVQQLNERHRFFGAIHALEHPRWIMQYRRKQVARYLAKYDAVFTRAHAG